MRKKQHLWIILLVAAGLFGLGGCSSTSPEESQLPWSEPKSWEGGPPGFGSDSGFGREY